MPDYEVALVTKGGDQAAAIAAIFPLLHGTGIPLRIYSRDPLDPVQRALLDGSGIDTFERSGVEGIGRARSAAIGCAEAPVVVMLDDDAVVTPHYGLAQLARLAAVYGTWVVPIIRYAENLIAPLDHHVEVWEQVDGRDERLERAVAKYGPGWARTFDTGVYLRVTDQLGGTAVAIPTRVVPDWAVEWLAEWPTRSGDEDLYLGRAIGDGLVTNEVVAWHWGRWHSDPDSAWQVGPVEAGLAYGRVCDPGHTPVAFDVDPFGSPLFDTSAAPAR